jgi:ABC-2 type transport system permease protein
VLQGIARNQPATAVADTLRVALSGGHVGASAWHAVAWSAGIIVVSIVLSGILFRRRAR